jgi:hypothetical protein
MTRNSAQQSPIREHRWPRFAAAERNLGFKPNIDSSLALVPLGFCSCPVLTALPYYLFECVCLVGPFAPRDLVGHNSDQSRWLCINITTVFSTVMVAPMLTSPGTIRLVCCSSHGQGYITTRECFTLIRALGFVLIPKLVVLLSVRRQPKDRCGSHSHIYKVFAPHPLPLLALVISH